MKIAEEEVNVHSKKLKQEAKKVGEMYKRDTVKLEEYDEFEPR